VLSVTDSTSIDAAAIFPCPVFNPLWAAVRTVSSQSHTKASPSHHIVLHLLNLGDAAVDAPAVLPGNVHPMTEHSVTQWIADLKAGDPDAAEELANRYFDRLVTLARKHLGSAPRRVADEEDVAISVLQRLCTGADQGRFPKLHDREDLWAVLLTVTKGKVTDQIRHLSRKKRGGGDVRGHSVLGVGSDGQPMDFAQCVADELSPEFLTQLDEEHQRLLGLLRDDTHRNIALWRMEGYSNDEIAKRLQISVKSVERKLRHIREKWAGEMA
jgi:RNA polymerase sigma factor (sigma-70 family)